MPNQTDAAPPREHTGRAYLLLLLMVLIWGANFSVSKIVLASVPPLAFNALRFPCAAIAVFAEIRRRNLIPADKMPYVKPLKARSGMTVEYDSGDYPAPECGFDRDEQVVSVYPYFGPRHRLAGHDVTAAPGATAEVPTGHPERALYIATGAVELDGVTYGAGKMLVLGHDASWLRAIERSAVMVLGGEPVGERFIYWNFVSSSKDRIDQARADWAAGRMKLPDLDNDDFIPLPPKPGAAPEPMS